MAVLISGNFHVDAGISQTSAANVPAGTTWANISMTRASWPAGGVTLRIFFSYDGTNYVKVREEFIAPGVFNPKINGIAPASIGFGWASPQPLKMRGETVSPSAFNTVVTLEAG